MLRDALAIVGRVQTSQGQGSVRADQLTVAEGSSLATMAPRLRDIGIFLEGLAFAEASAPTETP
jgi:hypothetical protein